MPLPPVFRHVYLRHATPITLRAADAFLTPCCLCCHIRARMLMLRADAITPRLRYAASCRRLMLRFTIIIR